MKILALLASATLLISGCKSNNEIETLHIKTPDLPDYSAYVELGDYKNLTYTLPDIYVVTDEKVDILFHSQLYSFAEKTEITDRPAKNGDEVLLNYTGTIDGKTFDNGSTDSNGQTIIIGYKTLTEQFENQLIGMKLDETKDISVSFPDDYLNSQLAGKTAIFKTTILKITELKYPEITDEFIAQNTNYETVDAMKTSIKTTLTTTYEDAKKEYVINELLGKIKDATTISAYPEDVISNLVDTSLTSVTISANKNAQTVEDFLKDVYGYETVDAYKDDMSAMAKEYMNIRMILNEIARKENITATDEEFETYKNKFAADNQFEFINNVNIYYKDSDILLDMLTEKIETWIYENAKKM